MLTQIEQKGCSLKIIVIGALPSSLINFRGKLIESFVESGAEVIAMASGATREEVENVESLGVRYIDYQVKRNGLNPLEDLKTYSEFKRVFRKEKPDVILAYTIKPVIWGGLAARSFSKSKFFALVTGLGFAFQRGGFKRTWLTNLVKVLYSIALSRSSGVIFQNPDNLNVFTEEKIVNKSKCNLVNGSGVDLSHFSKQVLTDEPRFLLIARLLGEKGVREYIAAAALVRKKFPDAVFDLVGPEDPSPDGIPVSEIHERHKMGVINYHGGTEDVRPYIESCNIFVLPSYHEGMPRTVLEAMATGRPVLTTNVPGCKETVEDGVNGWLVNKESISELADKMVWFIENPDKWQEMADASYLMAKEKFDVSKVNDNLLRIMKLN